MSDDHHPPTPPKTAPTSGDMTDEQWDEITRGRTALLTPAPPAYPDEAPAFIDNVVRPMFRTSAVNAMMEDFREVVRKPAYDKVTFCELIGVIELVKLEQYERNKE